VAHASVICHICDNNVPEVWDLRDVVR
jgi:hypothetical protein